jgi:predicted RNA-binding Zn-ribbon protein involved in translation (DUF1610 family)
VHIHADRCSDETCDYSMDFFMHTDERKCPMCREKKVVLTEQSQMIEYRLVCWSCGYQEPVISVEELHELL